MSRPTSDPGKRQSEIRNDVRAKRAALEPAYRDAASANIAEKIFRAHWFSRAENIACYLSVGAEVDSWPVVARAWLMGKRIFAPVVQENMSLQFREITAETDLGGTSFGLFEPLSGALISPRKLDIVITPLVAYDKNMNRVGMGGGCYDRTFAFLRNRRAYRHPKLIGVAFACQEVEKIDANAWDIPLFQVLTD
jgi:5-formyltetrahydrofolate cyclo-ligase